MRTVVTVSGMRSVHCVRAVQTALTLVAGVEWWQVTMGRIELEHDGSATAEALVDAIGVAGYVVSDVQVLPRVRRLPIAGEH
jgi:copper chaperone CopZ